MELPVIEEKTDSPWYAEGLSFTCTQCGNCCTGGPGYVWISKTEIHRLAEYLKMSYREVVEKYCRRLGGKYSLNEHRNARGQYDCTFLEERPVEKKLRGGEKVVHMQRVCTIYPVRPLQCRTWPFWEGNLASEKNWRLAQERCPGMGRGKEYSRDQIEALRDAPDWPDSPPSSK